MPKGKPPQAQIVRPTMEGVRQAQERLRWRLDQLIMQNRPVESEVERRRFLTEWSYATLGLGVNMHTIHVVDSLILSPSTNIEVIARWAVYLDAAVVTLPRELFSEAKTVPISMVWRTLRNSLFSVFPLAIERSCSISKEYEPTTERGGYDIE